MILRTCFKNINIKLLRIPYWDFDNIEEILIRELNNLDKGDKYENISE